MSERDSIITNRSGRPRREASNRIVDFSLFNERGFQAASPGGTDSRSGSLVECKESQTSGSAWSISTGFDTLESRSRYSGVATSSGSTVSGETEALFNAIVERPIDSIGSVASTVYSPVPRVLHHGKSPVNKMAAVGDDTSAIPAQPSQDGSTGTSASGGQPGGLVGVTSIPTPNPVNTTNNEEVRGKAPLEKRGNATLVGQEQDELANNSIVVGQGASSNESLPDPFGFITPGRGLVDGVQAPNVNPQTKEVVDQLSAVKQKHNDLLDRLRVYKEKQRVSEQEQVNMQLERELHERQMHEAFEKERREREQQFQRQVEDMERRFHAHEESLKLAQVQATMEHRRQLTDLEHKLVMQKMALDYQIRHNTITHQIREQERLNAQHQDAMAARGQGNTRVQTWVDNVTPGQLVQEDRMVNLNAVQTAIQRGEAVTDKVSGINILQAAGISKDNVEFIQAHANGGTAAVEATLNQPLPGNNIDVNLDLQGAGQVGGKAPTAAVGSVPGPHPEPGELVGEGARRKQVPQHDVTDGLAAFAGLNQAQRNLEVDDGESSISSVSRKKSKKKLKSGMVAKPAENIKSVAIWPHFSLHAVFAAAPLVFNQLTFEHLVAGEVYTIAACHDVFEIRGRLNLLGRLSLLKVKGYPWERLRELYAGVLTAIEMHKTTWMSDWRSIEDMCLDPADRVKRTTSTPMNNKNGKKEEWFCRNYNRPEGCQLTPPHEAVVGKAGKKRKVKHFCAACWLKEQIMREHSEVDMTCPNQSK